MAVCAHPSDQWGIWSLTDGYSRVAEIVSVPGGTCPPSIMQLDESSLRLHGRVGMRADGQTHTHTCARTHARMRDASKSSAVDVRVYAYSYDQADEREMWLARVRGTKAMGDLLNRLWTPYAHKRSP